MNEIGSSKTENSEIVESLIIITQDFYKNYSPNGGHNITIDETNLVPKISQALHSYRRQKDRIADLSDAMGKIASRD